MGTAMVVRLAMALGMACTVLPQFGRAQINTRTLTLSQADRDNRDLLVGATPPEDFRATIPAGSLLVNGDAGGRMYASTSAKVAPIHRLTVDCVVSNGQTEGTVTITLAHAYLFGMIGGHDSSSGAMPPTGLYVDSADPTTGGTDFNLHCKAFAAPPAGTTYIYTAQVAFYHPALAE
jgi:hypothetical protein